MIKSLDELRKIKEEYGEKVKLRKSGEGQENEIEILIGMATCGISSGARDTLNEFIERLSEEKISNAKVVSVGCIGYCHSEPTVQINKMGEKPVLYGNVTKDKVKEIVDKHIKNNQIVDNLILNVDFERA